jgi:hypothetical protein
MRRATLVALLASATFAGPAVASPRPIRPDISSGVRFSLTGSELTVRILPRAEGHDMRRRLWGKPIRALCSPTFNLRKLSGAVVTAVRVWPRRRKQLTYSFERDIANRVKWCLIEDASGGDVAAVDFGAFIRLYGTSASDSGVARRLRRYLLRNAVGQPWLRQVAAIAVNRGVIVVATELRPNRGSKRIAREICRLIHGADVADFTPGHSVLAHDLSVLRTCVRSRLSRRG